MLIDHLRRQLPHRPGARALSSLRRLVPSEGLDIQSPAMLGREAMAGIVASLVTIAHSISFATLIFQGDLKAGMASGLWGLLLGAAVASIVISLWTSMPPALAGPRNPAIAVMTALAATISWQVAVSGGVGDRAAIHVLLALTCATALLGLALLLLGAFRLGQVVRFVPYPVVGGFLAAAGALLIAGGLKLLLGADLSLRALQALSSSDMAKLAVAVGFVASVLLLRQWTGHALVLPLAFFGAAIMVDLALWLSGVGGKNGTWYVTGAGDMRPWVPLAHAASGGIDWSILGRALPEIGAIVGVTIITLMLDTTSLEVVRARIADLDQEFRANAAANLVAAPLGGFCATLALNPSRLIEDTGGQSRLAGVLGGVFVGALALTGIDLLSLVPVPILAGLVIFLGLTVLQEALLKAPPGRSWVELGLALAIMAAIIQYGYLAGVVLGFVGASLIFAFSYGRIGVVRRHLTRAAFASNVERGPEASAVLREEGGRIHVFWLSGFIFFGSSNGLFESIRSAIGHAARSGSRYVVLDCSSVTGVDTSAVLSLVKLRNWADDNGVVLAYAGAQPELQAALEKAGLIGSNRRHRAHPARNEALEWCEEQLLSGRRIGDARNEDEDSEAAFSAWLAREIGPGSERLLERYLERHDIAAGTLLYGQGGPSDTIDLVATGSMAVNVTGSDGRVVRVRRMTGHTVVGEMGFFRTLPRTASVSADEASVVHTLTRAAYDRLVVDDPELAGRFLQFIVRTLADRLEFANREVSALL